MCTYLLNICVSPSINMLKPNPQCDGIRGETFERPLGPKRGGLMSGSSALIKGTPENSPVPSAM